MENILTKQALPRWIEQLDAYQIYAPVREQEGWKYAIVDTPDSVTLDYPNTVLSLKSILFPQREVFLEFHSQNGRDLEVEELLPGDAQSVIFGVRPCDAKAISLMDKVFGGDYIDNYYWKRRNQTRLIGLACNEPVSPDCFCNAVDGAPYSTEGLDILMTDLGDRYFLESVTEKGEELLAVEDDLFQEAGKKDQKAVKDLRSGAEKKFERKIPELQNMPEILANLFDSDFWEQESMSCIRCGICTYLCPSCHCFDINDEVETAAPLKGVRVRTWDTCQFPDFTMHSSGHNPRSDRAARLRQRVSHKYRYFPEQYDAFLCTGCGRCIDKCPVGIDIVEVLNKAVDYEG